MTPLIVKTRILCVGDDAGFLNLGRLLLQNPGYQVWVAESGLRALNLLNARKPDVAIVDSQVFGTNGSELASKIKRLAPSVFVILVSDCQSMVKEASLFLDAASPKSDPVARLAIQIEASEQFKIQSVL